MRSSTSECRARATRIRGFQLNVSAPVYDRGLLDGILLFEIKLQRAESRIVHLAFNG